MLIDHYPTDNSNSKLFDLKKKKKSDPKKLEHILRYKIRFINSKKIQIFDQKVKV